MKIAPSRSLALVTIGFLSATAVACGPLETPVEPVDTDAAAAPPASMKDGGPDATVDGAQDTSPDAEMRDSTVRDTAMDSAPAEDFCALPGSVVWKNGAPTVVPGGKTNEAGALPDVSWVNVPDGFCVHYFATVPETRNLRVAPNGDLFVASPSQACTGGAAGGRGSVVVLPDDDHDGVADTILDYQPGIPQVQGLLFYNGYFYYQDAAKIMRVAYNDGDRVAPAVADQVADINVYVSGDHWPKTLDVDDMGNIFVGNGGEDGFVCDPTQSGAQRPFQGGILMIDPAPGGPHPNGVQVAKGLRNPIAVRCARGTGACFGLELAKDFDPQGGSREKLFPIRMGDDWGFPCCATADQQYTDVSGNPDCSDVSPEVTSFIIDHTPFGLDFEQGHWPGTWKKRTFVVLHGFFGSWLGARVVGIATQTSGPNAGWPVPASEADAGAVLSDFATGWYNPKATSLSQLHGRPAAITFAPDGRMFIGNDLNGDIMWIAPVK